MLDRRTTRTTETERRHRHSRFGGTMPLNRCRSLRGHAFEGPVIETNIFAGITTSEFSPALKIASVLGGVAALIVAVRVGRVMIKLLFGILGLAILGGAVWWFFLKH